MSKSRSAVPFASTVLAMLMSTAWAQSSPEPQRVEITGSAIKRIDAETALPVQVITREDIQKTGATTAAEIVATVSAMAKMQTDGVSIGTGGFKDQMGLNGANLRGIGVSSTLVLLNGRRMANFASPGDDSGVDLNNIPAAAIDHVEVLLDGASAIYGTDAIGGVINFITRKDYRGVQLDASVSKTKEGGAGKRTASIAAGFGDLTTDRFNVFGVLDVQKTDALNTLQRQFISDLQIPQRLPHLLSSAGFPANIRLSRDQRDYLQDQGFQINGKVIENRTINLSVPDCQPPHTLYLPLGIGGVDGCTYDFMRDLELYPESKKLGFLGRGVLQLTPDHQLFAEFSYSRSRTWYVGTSNRIDADVPIASIRAFDGYDLAPVDGDTVVARTRLLEGGNRASELVSTGRRTVLGASGTVGGWDYDAALNQSVNTVSDRDVRGYFLYDRMLQAFLDGTISPFQFNGPTAQAAFAGASVNQEVRSARGTMTSVDAKFSRAIGKLEGGDVMLALGGEWRRERTKSAASELLLSDNILGDPTPGDAQFTDRSRRVVAAYGELLAPISKTFEVQAALRHDRYQQIGSTTNPKLGALWKATPDFALRGSVGTGFRAPSVNDLYRPVKTGETAVLADPVCMAENDNDLSTCADFWETRTYANPNLKPERSTQFSTGFVYAPDKRLSIGVDYWAITKRDLISTIGDDVILGNLDKYEPLVHRYNEDEGLPGCDYDASDSSICFIELQKANRGREKAAGLDLTLEARGLKTSVGEFGAKLVGTLTLTSKRQTGSGDPYISNLGRFVTDGAVQRWRHRLVLDWQYGDVGLSLSNQYLSGYTDQNNAIDTDSGTVVAPNKVKAYSLWDLAGSWQATKDLTLRAGIKNLADTPPPFSNQAYFFISGYDPSYTDPRGRSFSVSLSWTLK